MRLILVVVLFVETLVAGVHAQGKGACHPQSLKRRGANCTTVTLPRGMCQACGVGAPMDDEGAYLDCTRTTLFEDEQGNSNQECLNLIQEFLNLNECDHVRKRALEMYLSGTNVNVAEKEEARLLLDYFVYSICENACDCMPMNDVNITFNPINLTRGNCPGHTVYDICQIFPNITLIGGEDDSPVQEQEEDLPAVCPPLD